jgi:CRISPR-associated protein Cmr5
MVSHDKGAEKRTLEQKRAEHALNRVKEVKEKQDVDPAAYRSYTERLPAAIVANGLGQALAMERAAAGEGESAAKKDTEAQQSSRSEARETKADKKAHALLYRNLSDWLCDPANGVYRGAEDALEALIEHDQQAYVRAQVEALAWLDWHKKFCQAMLPRREEN